MTQIEWTHLPGFKGASWNPVVGCSVVSPGCTNCYAMKQAGRILRMTDGQSHYAGTVTGSKAGPVWTGKVARASDKAFTAPLRRRVPTCYFVNSMGDLFAEGVPERWIDQVFAVMGLSPQHRFIVLTKRPERMREYVSAIKMGGPRYSKWAANGTRYAREQGRERELPPHWPLPNVWLGVSVEDQLRAEERIPLLLDTPAAVRFISAEPLLGPVDLRQWQLAYGCGCGWGGDSPLDYCRECGWRGNASGEIGEAKCDDCGTLISDYNACPECDGHCGDMLTFGTNSKPRIDWVICGGESGPDARPMHPDWARSLRDQCAAAGVPFFFKQWGEWAPCPVDPSGLPVPAPYTPHYGYLHPDGRSGKWPVPAINHGPRELSKLGFAPMAKFGKRAAGHLLDGVEHFNWPADPADPAGVPA